MVFFLLKPFHLRCYPESPFSCRPLSHETGSVGQAKKKITRKKEKEKGKRKEKKRKEKKKR